MWFLAYPTFTQRTRLSQGAGPLLALGRSSNLPFLNGKVKKLKPFKGKTTFSKFHFL